MKKRFLSALLALCVALTLLPGTALAASAGDDAADTGDDAVFGIRQVTLRPDTDSAVVWLTATEACTLGVALYDGDGRLLDVKQYDVPASPEEQTVSAAIPADRPEAFTLKAFLLDSGSRPLCQAFSASSGAMDTTSYSVTALVVNDGGTAVSATVSSGEACVIRLEVASADGSETLFTQSLDVEPSLVMEEVSVPLSGALPEEFRLTAQLVTGSGDPLSAPYTTRAYTKAYQASAGKTLAELRTEYPAEQVLDFDDDGFGVLADGVEQVTGTASEADGRYTFPASDAPAVGDVLLLTLADGSKAPIKAGAVTDNGDGTYTVTPSSDATVSDFYQYLNIDSTRYVSGTPDEPSVALMDDGWESPRIKLSHNYCNGLFSLEMTALVRVESVYYYDENTDPEYMETRNAVHIEADLSATVGQTCDSSEYPPIELEIVKPVTFPVGATGLCWTLSVTAPLDFEFQGGGTLGCTLIAESGYQHNTDNEKGQSIWDKSLVPHIELGAKFEFTFGPQISGGVCLPNEVLSLTMDGQFGAFLTGDLDQFHIGADKSHACDVCVDIDAGIFAEISASLKYNITPKLRGTILKITIAQVRFSIGDFYFSLSSPEDSYLKGKATFGVGTCPNYRYRVRVSAQDSKGETVTGAPASILDSDGAVLLSTTTGSGDSIQLFTGSYTAAATINSREYTTGFSVEDQPMDVTVKEQTYTVTLTVTDKDKGTPLSDVSVSCFDNVEGKVEATGTTNSGGRCTLRLLPGSHTFTCTLDKYDDATATVNVTSSATANATAVVMQRTEPYAKLTVNVVDENGDPVSGIPVGAVRSDGGYSDSALSAPATLLLEAGTYTVATHPLSSAYESDSASVTLTAGEERSVTLTAKKAGVILSGVVTGIDPDTQEVTPLSGATVTATASDGTAISATTGGDGSYELGLDDGSFTVQAGKSGYAPQSVTLTLSGGEPKTQDFQLEKQETGWFLSNGVLTIWGNGPMDNYNTSWHIFPPWYSDRATIQKVIIAPGITAIGTSAFAGAALTSVSIPDSVTSIGDGAFSHCTTLTSISIPGSVTTIERDAFSQCKALASVNISNGVTSIGDFAFYSCRALTSVNIPGSVTSIGDSAFAYCSKMTSVSIPDSVTSIGDGAFQSCFSLTSVTIPDSVTSIGNRVFDHCTKMTSVTIPGSVTSIGGSAFNYCTELTSVTIPSSVTSIGASAFNYCEKLASVNIPDGVSAIYYGTFSSCSALTSLTIPDSVTSIGDDAFNHCTALTSVNIPGSVTSIGKYAFTYCTKLTSLTIPDSVTSIGNGAFSHCTTLTSITIPGSVTSLGNAALASCTALTSVTIPDSVTSIGSETFNNCTALTSLTIPGSVTSIGEYAFNNCTALTSLTIPGSVTAIGKYAFKNCTVLTDIYYGGSEEAWTAACQGTDTGIDTTPATIHYNSEV